MLQNEFGHSSLIAWMGSEQAVTDTQQQPAAAPSLPQAEGAGGLIFGKIPRYHKPPAVSLYSTFLSLIAYAITRAQAIKPKPMVNTEICLHF